jgi:leucyl aminopeptidase
MKILYKPNFTKTTPKYYKIFVFLDENNSNHDGYHIHSNKLISDLKAISKRLASTLKTVTTSHFIIHLSSHIIDLKDSSIIEHILWKFLKQFLPWNHDQDATIIVTHDSNKFHKNIADFVKLSIKMRDARLLAMTPANIAYPSNMTHHFKTIFDVIPRTKVRIFNFNKLKKDGFNLIVAVGDSGIQ